MKKTNIKTNIKKEVDRMGIEQLPGSRYALRGRIYLGSARKTPGLSHEGYFDSRFYLIIHGIEEEGDMNILTWYLSAAVETEDGEFVLDEKKTSHTCPYQRVNGGYKLEGTVPRDFVDEIVEYLEGLGGVEGLHDLSWEWQG